MTNRVTEQKTLRGLARAYANGLMTKEHYRRERAIYLESVLSGKVPLPEPKPDSTTTSGPITDFNIRRLRRTNYEQLYTQSPSTDKTQSRKTGLLIAGIAIIVVILIVTMLIPFSNDSDLLRNDDTIPQDIAALNMPPTGAQNMITDFLRNNMWGQGNLESFVEKWQTIPESERAFAMNSTEYSRLLNAIYKKLLEERALSRIGNPQTSYEKQRQLVDFASKIGIKDQRISLPDKPPGADR